MRRRIAIAGAGNVGRSIANELIEHGHEVLIIERASGTLTAGSTSLPVSAGATLVMPFDAAPASLTGDLRCLLCLPPGDG